MLGHMIQAAVRRTGPLRTVVVALLALSLIAALASLVATSNDVGAQAATDFELSASVGHLAGPTESTEVTITITPNSSAIAAVGALISYDDTAMQATGCSVLIGLGACNVDIAGQINVQTVDAAGWATATDLFTVNFTGVSVQGIEPLSIAVTEAYAVDTIEIVGGVEDGAIVAGDYDGRGDVNCDNIVDVIDALFIVQYDVTVREALTSCPLPNPRDEMNLARADFNQDGSVDVIDALFIAQCDSFVENGFCNNQ